MARTFPTCGVSPIDAYVTDDRPCAYFEHIVTLPSTAEVRAVYVVATPTMISGGNYIGFDVRVTTAGTAGTWASAIYAKMTQGTTKNVNGYLCAAEFELANAVVNPSNMAVLVLNCSVSYTGTPPAAVPYIMCRDYGSTDADVFARFLDHTKATTDGTKLISSTTGTFETNVDIALAMMYGTTKFWLLGSTTTPA